MWLPPVILSVVQTPFLTPNTGIYIPMYPCSIQNGHIFTLILAYGFVPLSVIQFDFWKGGEGGEENRI